MLHEYSKQKENILAIYEMLERKNSSFIDQNLKVEIIKKRESLQNDQFVLAVAGQMKAGKSTLLNSLIFGDDILPADDTELTAKITFITYGDEPSYEATLYTKSEFDELRSSMKGTESENEFNKLLNESLENLQKEGYSSYEELLSKKKIIGKNLKDLIDFVGKKGVFTPFVNSLILKTNSNWVKNIIVVDTPGMNSPNQLRDKVVKDWIIKADAVLYCSYAGRAMDATDLDFIKDYMLHVSPKHRLFALTKSDLIDGEDRLMNTIGDMINAQWNKKHGLIPDRNTVFPISQMAVLLDKIDKSGVEFTPRMEEEYEMLKNRIDFEHCNNQFLKLELAIEKKLIANKDFNIIETHQQYLDTIFSEKLHELNEDIDSCKKSLELINSDKDELNEKEIQIKKDIASIARNLDGVEKKIKNNLDKDSESIKITSETNCAINAIKKKLHGLPLNDLDTEAPKVIEDKFSSCVKNLKEQVDFFSKSFAMKLELIFATYDFQLEYLNSDLIKDRIECKSRSYINSKIDTLRHELGEVSVNLKQNYSDTIGIWRKFGDSFRSSKSVDQKRGKEALDKFVLDCVKPMEKKFSQAEKEFMVELTKSISEIIGEIKEDSRKKLDKKEDEIKILKSNIGKDIEKRKQIEDSKKNSLDRQKKELKAIIAEIKNKI